ncbi:MAG: hypothetical protein ACLSGB_08325 [Dorea sp.]
MPTYTGVKKWNTLQATLGNLMDQTAFFNLTVGNYVMILVACVFFMSAISTRI